MGWGLGVPTGWLGGANQQWGRAEPRRASPASPAEPPWSSLEHLSEGSGSALRVSTGGGSYRGTASVPEVHYCCRGRTPGFTQFGCRICKFNRQRLPEQALQRRTLACLIWWQRRGRGESCAVAAEGGPPIEDRKYAEPRLLRALLFASNTGSQGFCLFLS